MVWHPETQSYVETMARVQLDYFLTSHMGPIQKKHSNKNNKQTEQNYKEDGQTNM